MSEIRVLITDDDPLVRVALSHFVARDPEITVVAEAENGIEAIAAVEQHKPDIVMMDVQMPGMGGIEATGEITSRWPEVCVVAVTTLDGRDTVLPMLGAGASGYMLKDSSAEEIVAALRQAYQGTSSLSPRIAAMLVKHVREEKRNGIGDLEELSERGDRGAAAPRDGHVQLRDGGCASRLRGHGEIAPRPHHLEVGASGSRAGAGHRGTGGHRRVQVGKTRSFLSG